MSAELDIDGAVARVVTASNFDETLAKYRHDPEFHYAVNIIARKRRAHPFFILAPEGHVYYLKSEELGVSI